PNELVAFQSRGDVVSGFGRIDYLLKPYNFAYAAEAHDLIGRSAQSDYVLERAAHIKLSFRSEQDPAGTDVLSEAGLRNALSAVPSDATGNCRVNRLVLRCSTACNLVSRWT